MSREAGPRLPRPGTEVTCQISLELDGLEKTVVQLRKGDQSEDLRELAAALLAVSRGHAERGITPTGLADALAKVASGELAPELLSLSVQRKPMAGQEGRGLAPRGAPAARRGPALHAGRGIRRGTTGELSRRRRSERSPSC